MDLITESNCTLYVPSLDGYSKIECSRVRVFKQPWVQYNNTIEYQYTGPQGKGSGLFMKHQFRVVILAGWDHPEAGDAAFFDAYKAEKNPRVLADIKEG